ncbi:MAG: nucleotidyltransferase domain-containing protein [Acidimicrobiia bacterium]|nr:nucleotidyltransferase domain-containing protein [Acidimicrobiia bacterium]
MRIAELAERLAAIDGVVGVALGGSRARGTHTESSDYDFGLYYEESITVRGVEECVRSIAASLPPASGAHGSTAEPGCRSRMPR